METLCLLLVSFVVKVAGVALGKFKMNFGGWLNFMEKCRSLFSVSLFPKAMEHMLHSFGLFKWSNLNAGSWFTKWYFCDSLRHRILQLWGHNLLAYVQASLSYNAFLLEIILTKIRNEVIGNGCLFLLIAKQRKVIWWIRQSWNL